MRETNLRQFDLNLLHLFEAIHQTGSVTAAADRVAISQSAASHALARLREQVGDELFVRTGRALVATPIARRLYPQVQAALERLRSAISDAQGFEPGRSARTFTVAIPHILGPRFALDIRDRAHRAAPNVVLHFDTRTQPGDLAGDLAEGLVDLAVDWMPVTRPAFVNRVVMRDRIAVLVGKGHPVIRPGASLSALLTAEYVYVQARRATDELPAALEKLQSYPWRMAISVSEALEVPAIVAMTTLGGLMLLSGANLVAGALGLEVVDLPEEMGEVPIYAVWHESRRADPGHVWLRDIVADVLAADRQ